MKKAWLLNTVAAVGVLCLLIAGTSCEWDRAGDEDTWNDAYDSRYEWVNFSGVYKHSNGWYVVSQFRRPSSGGGGGGGGGGSSVSGAQTVDVGDGNDVQRSFGGDMPSFGGSVPVMAGTFSIRATIQPAADVEVFSDRDNDGLLYSSQASNLKIGFINYYTGAFSVEFLFPVVSNTDVIATYVSGTSSSMTNVVVVSTQRPRPGSSEPIYQFLVFQDGYRLRLTDNYGNVYEGRIVTIYSTAGGVSTDIRPGEAVTVIASFEASGNGAMLSGTLEGTYTAAQEDQFVDPLGQNTTTQDQTTDYRGTMENRVIRGVWVEDDGMTGEIAGVSTEPAVINPN